MASPGLDVHAGRTTDEQSPQDRRDVTGREKLQLSCNPCRKRKVRCDRQVPCNNCSSRGTSSLCIYPTRPTLGRPRAHVQDRIDHLESLVLSLMQRQQQPAATRDNLAPQFDTTLGTPSDRRDHVGTSVDVDIDIQVDVEPPTTPSQAEPQQCDHDTQRQVSPSPSDYGTIRMRESGLGYASNTHWLAILDSITQLREHVALNNPSPNPVPQQHAALAVFDRDARPLPRPRLLYGVRGQASFSSILQAVPPRPTADRLVSRYFNDLDMATGIVHRGKFVREYESFWQAPQAVSGNIMWLGQLFAIMCLSSQFQQLVLGPNTPTPLGISPDQDNELEIATFQDKSVDCLILGRYTEGGPYVLETLILYFLSEIFPLKEVDVGIWMLVGTIVQVAMHMGYHRDAAHFPQSITPFAGEMRRRVWSMVVQIDFSISTQLGMPRLVSQANTTEPRNLIDSDFDESTADLPPSRPQSEVTPILYTLAKLRILSVGVRVSDLTMEPRTYPYNEVLHLDQQINDAMDSLPSSMKWEGLSSSLTATPLVLMQRIWLNMCIQRLKVILHKRFLVSSLSERQKYTYSRSTCLNAAMKILEFQHLIDEETRPDGRLYQIRWRVSTAVTQEFLLATSVLCLYLQTRVQNHEQHSHPQQRYTQEDAEVSLQERVRQLLKTSLDIWFRLSAESTEARRAAEALQYVLRETEPFTVENTISGLPPAPLDFQGFLRPMPNFHEGIESEESWADLMNDPNNFAPWAGGVESQHMGLFSLCSTLAMSVPSEPIAIIGSGCRFPGGANTPSKLWELLRSPRDLLQKVPPKRRFHPEAYFHDNPEHHGSTNVQASYFLEEDPAEFDNGFFNIQPAESEAVDPQQRMLMETIYDALCAGGQTLEALRGSSTAVMVGMMCDDWGSMMNKDWESLPQYSATGVARSIMSNRVSYFMDWHGPSITLDTACSSSLVAVHLAVQALRCGESRVAVAAGANLILNPGMYIAESNLHMLSPTGRSRMWDRDADGYARGEGIAAVVLKTLSAALEDGDPIECVIRNTGVNQDGKTRGLTMPSATAQAALIQSTYARAGLDITKAADRPQFFHAHGTGTPAGDPQESQAIAQAFFGNEASSDKLYVGSIKTIIGHTEGAAGLASLIGSSLALQHGIIPPNMHFSNLSPSVAPFYGNLEVPTTTKPWPNLVQGQPRRVSVNSFGFGGTNAHAIIDSYETPVAEPVPGPLFTPLVISAANERSLRSLIASYSTFLNANREVSLQHFAHTLQAGRSTLPYRAYVAASTPQHASRALDALLARDDAAELKVRHSEVSRPRILAVFTGQGAQWPRMGARLIDTSPFANKRMDDLDAALALLPSGDRPDWTLRQQILADKAVSRVSEASISQPLCTAVQIVLVDFLRVAGVNFQAAVGHSSGEIAAAYASGLLSDVDAIRIAYYRGLHAKLAKSTMGTEGAMMAVGTSFADGVEFCELEDFNGKLQVAAHNSPSSITLSGDEDAIASALEIFQDEGIFARRLRVDTAYHSNHMLPCAGPYLASMEAVTMSDKRLNDNVTRSNWYSSVFNGRRMSSVDVSPDYWVKNMTQPVLFAPAVAAAAADGPFDLCLEIGPHAALKGPCLDVLQDVHGERPPYTGVLSRGNDDILEFSNALGTIWSCLGTESVLFDFFQQTISGHKARSHMLSNLPAYPFDHSKMFWSMSRISGGHAMIREPPHPILGRRCLDRESAQEIHWRNILRPKEISWLQGHKIQGHIVFPAAGYVAMVVEAMKILAAKSSISLVSIENLVLGRAMAFDHDDASIETNFSVTILRSDSDSISARFSCSSAPAKQSESLLTVNAVGQVTVELGIPELDKLSFVKTEQFNMTNLQVDRFYSQLSRLQYEYSPPFRGMLSIQRKLGYAAGTLEDQAGNDWEDQLLVHPGMVDTAIQSALAAFSCPGDGHMREMYVPVRAQSIIINPFNFTLHDEEKENIFSWEAFASGDKASRSMVDISVASQDNVHTIMQIEGMELAPLAAAQAENDVVTFSKIEYSIDTPHGDLVVVDNGFTTDDIDMAVNSDRISFYYLRRLVESISPEERAHALPHYQSLLAWATKVVTLVKTGGNPFVPSSCQEDTEEQIDSIASMLNMKHDRADIRLLQSVGRNLPHVVRTGAGILEYMTEDGLFEFYDTGLGLDIANRHVARMAAQLTHRYPHMNILEIGAGTGGTTRNVLPLLDTSFSSYTYTDISSGFFDAAKERFRNYSSRMQFQTFDMERPPAAQELAQGSYDLVLGANVLHATDKLDLMMTHVRQLLKPGGWLIALEIESHDNLRTGLTMGCFPGWWAGVGQGRDDGPALTLPQWDNLLQKCGFGGIETSTPLLHKLHGSVVFAAQAVDDRVSLLRSPLTSNDAFQPDGGPPLIVIGGQTLPVHRIAEQVKGYLAPYFGSIVRVASLEDLGDAVPPTSSILSLCELDGPLFDNITPSTFEALKNVWRYARDVLWITRGSKAETPYSFMTVGLGRVLQFEHPNISLEILDIDTIESGTPRTVAEELLRLKYLKKWGREGQGQELLWSFENEVHIESGARVIPRLRKSEQANARFNSSRRAIAAQAHHSPIHFACDENSLYELHIPSPLLIPNSESKFNSTISLRVSHFLLQIIQVARYGRLMLCAGTNEATGEHILALSPVTQSHPSVPGDWTVCLEGVSPIKAIAAVASDITAANILALAPAGSTILVHEPDEGVAKALTRQAQASSTHVVITSSRNGPIPGGWQRVHSKLSQRSAAKLLPRSPALFVNLSQAPGSTEAGQLIAKSLEPSCLVCGSEDFYGASTRTRPGHLNSQVSQALKNAWAAAAHEIASQDEFCCPVLELQRVPGFSVVESPMTIADCSDPSSVSANLQPIDSGDIFRADRTYLLVGLAGDVGQSLCQWMVEHGARYIVMASRHPNVCAMFIRSMEALGATILVSTLDITSRESLHACYDNVCKNLPPVAGVANGAMVLEDTLFDNLSFETMTKVLQPKVLGSQLLDELFHDTPLEFFILFGSITSIIGNSGQSPYIAANMFMTALAAKRRQRGVVGSAIAIASLIGIGYVERDEHLTGEHFERYGTKNISEQDLHKLFAEGILIGRPGCSESTELITGLEPWYHDAPEKPQFFADIKFQHFLVHKEGAQLDVGNVVTAPVRVQLATARSRDAVGLIVQDSFMSRLKRILMLSTEDEIDEKASLVEQGLDSLMAVEVRSWFLKELEVDVPVLKILSGCSIPDLLAHALERVPSTIVNLQALPEKEPYLTEAAREPESDVPRKESPSPLAAEQASSTTSIDGRDQSLDLVGDSRSGSGSRSPPSTESSVVENYGEKEKTDRLAERDDSGGLTVSATQETVTPMSYGQSRFWFLSDYLSDKTSFNMTVMLKLKGKIQARRMEQAVHTIAHRHDALRTRFFWSGEGDQRVAMQGVVQESHVRLTHKTVASEAEASIELAKLHTHIWDLGSWESAKVILLSGPEDTHYLIVGGHHISWDGYSFTMMFLDLDAAYSGKPLLPLGPESQYPTFSTWQTDMYETGGMTREIDKWKTVIPQNTPPIPLFPFARSQTRPILDQFFQYEEKAVLAKPLVSKLKLIARKNGSTMFHLYLGALKALVFRLLPDIDDCFIGLADANRIDKRFMGSLGFFLNLLPIPFSRGPPRTKISDLVKDARDRAFGSLARSVVPWNVILKELKIPRTNTCAPIFQLFVDYRQIVQERPTWCGCKLVGEEWLNARNGYDLTLGITDNIDESLLSLRFQANIYDEASTKLFLRSYVHVLETFAEGVDLSASALPCWAPSDIATAIQAGKGPTMKLEWPLTVSHRVDQMIQEHAGDPALKDGLGNSLTYTEMGHRINAIAAVLLKAGATTGVRIGVFQDPSTDCICSMLATLRVGATYIPLDRRNSMARLASVVQEAQPSIIVSDRYTRPHTKLLGADGAEEVVVSEIPTPPSGIASPVPNLARPQSPAIILFTSGTTGKPKGIILTHSNLRAQSEGYSRTCGIPSKASVVLQQTIHSFDVSLDQIFAALADGGCLVVVPADKRGDPRAVTQMMIDYGVSYTVATPSEYGMWFRHARGNLLDCSTWRAAFGGGEHLPSSLIQEFKALALPRLSLYNNYGPTEASLAITKGKIDYRDPELETQVPAGFILPNYQVIIVNEQLEPVPLGVPGEIVVGGPGVAAGYLGPPEITTEKFISGDKLRLSGDKGTWYRTGDKGHLRHDGVLYVRGRIAGDFQVKIRGFRVEIAEIEAVILESSKGALTRAVVTARGSGEDRFLAAHVVWAANHPQALRDDVVRRLRTELPLPSYMQPAVIVSIDSVPVTRNFKIDRNAIQALELPDLSADIEKGCTSDVVATITEQKLAQLWRSVISHGIGDLTSETSFFDVGGNSIQLVKLQSAIKRSLHSAPRLVEMMNCGTLEEMARLIDANSTVQAIDWAKETSLGDLAEDLVKPKALGLGYVGVKTDGLSIVLAGASGYLGRNLLARLLDQPEVSQIHCLVRDTPSPSLLALSGRSSKVTLVTADLSQPNLGLSSEKYAFVAEKAHVIINCAANRSFWDGYESLRQVNLEAVKKLARLGLAKHGGGGRARPLAFHQLSSGAVRSYDDGGDGDGLMQVQPPTDGTDGYVSSKWAAEQFLRNLAASAKPTGLDLQLYIHRPTALPYSIIDPSSSSSAIGQDVLQELLRITRTLGSRPDFTALHGHVDVVPVADVVGDLVASIIRAAPGGSAGDGAARVLEHGARVRVYVKTLAEAIAADRELAALPVMNPLYWFRDIKLAGLGYLITSQELVMSSGSGGKVVTRR